MPYHPPMLGLALCVLCLQDSAAPASRPDERPDVVLVTIDTLRRDALGCYGYPRPTSPRVDALAAESVVFERAFAPIATTFPSHLSMLTGQYPHQHGHTSNQGAVRRPFQPEAGHLSAASALSTLGYRTAAFVSAVVLNERTGIGAGFEAYDAPKVNEGKRAASETMARALTWLASAPSGQPFFLWVHLWDVHEPNVPEPRFAELLAPDDVLRRWLGERRLDPTALTQAYGSKRAIGERFFLLPPEEESEQRGRGPRASRKRSAPAASFTIDEEALVALHARYDACVRQVDEQVGRLIDALAARDRWSRTAFLFTGDHGQSLGENQHLGHGANTQVNVAVPLLIRFPAGTVAPGRSSALVSLVDLVPTLVGALRLGGLDDFRRQLSGADVTAPGFARERILTAEATEFHRGEKKPYACAVLTGRWKYVRAEGTPGVLYDLAGAGESVDVATANPGVVAELGALLAAELESSVLDAGGAEPVDPEAAELQRQLKNLGYGGDDEDE